MKENELIQLIKKSLKTKQKIDINSKSNNIEEWDSIGHLILLSNLDKKLKGATSNIADILKKNKLIK